MSSYCLSWCDVQHVDVFFVDLCHRRQRSLVLGETCVRIDCVMLSAVARYVKCGKRCPKEIAVNVFLAFFGGLLCLQR